MNLKKNFIATAICAIIFSGTYTTVSGQNATLSSSEGQEIIVRGQPTHIEGVVPQKGEKAPDFSATQSDMTDVRLSSFHGKNIILNIFPSLDTPTCATSVRFFNEAAAELHNTVVLCLSMDLPFAQERFCTVEGIKNVIPLSLFRSNDFCKEYGLKISEGPMRGLMARAVIAIDESGNIIHTQIVKNISDEPDYGSVLNLFD